VEGEKMKVEGTIISGEFDLSMNEFSLHTVKHLFTESTLKESQINRLYEYLNKHKHEDGGQFITLYDQMPIRLSQVEINQLLGDLERIKELYH
jgi:hypothetical protein